MNNTINLSRLTLVVPTYERQDFVLRLIDFWSNKGPKLIILDGSENPMKAGALNQLGAPVQYLHRPTGMYQRLQESLDLIQTEFVALAGDDEFYIPSAVDACIRELDGNKSIVACCGRALAFTPCDQTVCGGPQYPEFENYFIGSDEPASRVFEHMSDYVPSLIYAICKTKPWKNSWKHILEREFQVCAIAELQFEMLMSYAGKSKVIPALMWLRSRGETEPIRGTDPSLDPSRKKPDWWANPGNSVEREEFLTIMAAGFSTFSNQAEEFSEYRSTVVKGVEAYLNYYEQQRNLRRANLLGGFARRLIPDRYKKAIKHVFHLFHLRKDFFHTPLIDAAKLLEVSGVCVDYEELKNIESIIRIFYRKRANLKSAEGMGNMRSH